MRRLIFPILITLGFIIGGLLHYREYRKSREFAETFRIQSEIEFKRTSLLVIQQQLLQNIVRELDALKQGRTEAAGKELSRLFDSLPEERQEAQP